MKKETTFGWRQACGYIAEHIEVQEYWNGEWICLNDPNSLHLDKKGTFRLKPTTPEPARVPVKGDKIQAKDRHWDDWKDKVFHGFYQDKVVVEVEIDGRPLLQVWDEWRWHQAEKAEEMVSVKKTDLEELVSTVCRACRATHDYNHEILFDDMNKVYPFSDNK